MKTKTIFAAFIILFSLTFEAQAKFSTTPISLNIKTLDGEVFDLAKMRGKPVIISFWVSWCDICRKEILALNSLHQKNKNIEIIALNFDQQDDEEDFLKILATLKPTYKIAKFSEANEGFSLVPHGLPTTYILNKTGAVQQEFFVNNSDKIEQELLSAIESVN